MSQNSQSLSFSLAINLRPQLANDQLVSIPVDLQGTSQSVLIAGYLRGRTLPVAAARFLELVTKELSLQYS